MGAISVDNIVVTQLKRITVDGGDVLHALKDTDPGFRSFGEAYFSMINVGAVKAWKRHVKMTLNLIAPLGSISIVFIDNEGQLRMEQIGLNNYVCITVPPGIWFGFKGVGDSNSMLLNIADIKHDPAEIERKSLAEFIFNWEDL